MKNLAAFFLCFCSAILATGQYEITESTRLFPIADYCEILETADVDADGDPDLIYADFDGRILWFQNDGAASFGVPPYPGDSFVDEREDLVDLLCMDATGDGFLDILAIAENSTDVLLYEFDGSGRFLPAVNLGVSGADGVQLLAADLDGDDVEDLVVATYHDLSTYAHDGSGNWSTIGTTSTGLSNNFSQACALDIDSDGDKDLVFSALNEGVYLCTNPGTGLLDTPVLKHVPGYTLEHLVVADFDNDGDSDFAATTSNSTTIWYENIDQGTTLQNAAVFANSPAAISIDAGDFDNDGYLDVVVGASGNGKLVYYNNEGGYFDNDYETVMDDVRPRGVIAADADGDGLTDILCAGREQNDLFALTNDGTGLNWALHTCFIDVNYGSGGGSELADIDGDGYLDLVVSGHRPTSATPTTVYPYRLVWMKGNGTNTFAPLVEVEVFAWDIDDWYNATEIHAVDTHADGFDDLVVVDGGHVHILGNNGGVLGFDIEHEFIGHSNGREVEIKDLEGDGDLDVMFHSKYIGGESVAFRRNNSSWSEIEQEVPGYSWLANIDGDDLPDLLVYNSNGFDWIKGAGEAQYGSTLEGGLPNIPNVLGGSVGDFNNDGFDDFVLFTAQEVILTLENPGLADTAWEVTCIHVAQNADIRYITVVDLDGNGMQDVLLELYDGSGVELAWMQRSGEHFLPLQWLTADIQSYSDVIEIVDYNGDGNMDILSRFDDFPSVHFGASSTPGQGCTDPAACNYYPQATADDGNCCYACGCTLPAAVNYNPSATCDDGSCIHPEGCTDSDAVNYDPDALTDDGSCLGQVDVLVFDDLNANGYLSFGEPGIAFSQVVEDSLGMMFFTDNFGEFSTTLPLNQTYSFRTINHPNYPYQTGNNPSTIFVNGEENVNLGISKEQPVYQVCIDFYPNGNGFLCNDYANHNLCFRNMSNVAIDGILSLEIDPLFQGWQEVTPIDSANGNTVYMSFEDLPPGEMYFYDILLLTPTVDHIGEYVTSTATIEGFNQEGYPVASGEQTLHMEITCAYDPNDKQAFPLGFGDDHRLLEGTTQEFLVRFQNTGNAPAQDVVIVDTLDVNFDIESFELVANSHNMQAQVDMHTREVRFQFFDIQLPDSTCCEPESHGLVSYRIKPLAGLEPETRLENTAYIYFDNNEPIVTNTTWTTIHACGQDLAFQPTLVEDCPVHLPSVSSNYIAYSGLEGDFYWTADGDLFSDQPELVIPHVYDGNIQLTVDNPLCTEMANVDWTHLTTDFVWHTCPGDVDCSGTIGTADLNGMLGQFACADGTCAYEMTGDGEVSAADLLVVLGLFGLACE